MRPALLTATALLVFAAAPAFAQEEVVPLDPTPATRGFGFGNFNDSFNWTGPYVGGQLGYANGDPNTGGDDDAFIGGFRIGYDQEFGSFVLGVRADYEFTELDVGSSGEIDGIFRIGARAGFDQGRNLLYGIGGFADTDTSGVSSGDGFYVGGGYEVYVTDRITAGAEVIYHDLEGFGGTDVEVVTATVGLNFRF